MGDVPELILINPRRVTEGRFLNPMDVDEKRKVVVIGQRVRDVLFERDEEAIGEYILISGVWFRVIGVFQNMNDNKADDGDLETIYTPISTYQQAFNIGDNIGWLSINTVDGVNVSSIEDKVFKVLAERHLVSPEDKRAFGHYNMEEGFLKMQNLFIGIRFLIWLVGIGTLLAGVIGISNIMLIVVKERTKEIGIRKAIGAPPLSIVSQIVAETLILTSVAGYVGLVVGVFAMESLNSAMETYGLSGEMFRNPEVDFGVAITATVVIIFAGAVAGFIPASVASRINPVIALKSEG
ncbi:ABC transporter permease [bacterium SCSIO 12741]|nr:ABC transporter permease [bacterium SCSIO 12741]